MIAMQYSFALPADYDMSIIDRRVRDKGHILDDHAPLIFKAYLGARQGDAATASCENLYAPFYLWRDTHGMRDFVGSPGFAALARAFGWPIIRSWPAVVSLHRGQEIRAAKFATRETLAIPPFVDLPALQEAEDLLCRAAVAEGRVLLALAAFEPGTWTLVRFRLYRAAPPSRSAVGQMQAYNVLHVSNPAG